ncbi:MAG: ABC transporter ATP-binding protein [Candidatus Methylomirabilales bacterium]
MEVCSLTGTRTSEAPREAAATRPPKIVVDDLAVAFGGRRALAGVSLAVRDGEFLAIVGPSGCGKSTLLRVLAGLRPASAGRVRIDGEEVRGPSPLRNLVFQEHALYPWRTTAQNIALGLEIRGLPRDEIRARTSGLLELVGLAGCEHQYPHQLSGGMRQRAALARVLAVDPDVLLLDEPFGALDAITRLMLQRELLRLWDRSKKTVVLVTHDVEEALYLADRVAVMSAAPARMSSILAVPEARPRDRGSASLAELKRAILELLGLEGRRPGQPLASGDAAHPHRLTSYQI